MYPRKKIWEDEQKKSYGFFQFLDSLVKALNILSPIFYTFIIIESEEEPFQSPWDENTLAGFLAGTVEWVRDSSYTTITVIMRDLLPLNFGSMHH